MQQGHAARWHFTPAVPTLAKPVPHLDAIGLDCGSNAAGSTGSARCQVSLEGGEPTRCTLQALTHDVAALGGHCGCCGLKGLTGQIN
eukprot:scaffold206516_cov23-Tisochrysis_lutea.AAC.3